MTRLRRLPAARRAVRAALAAAPLAVLAPAVVGAQGSLGTQGFGFPVGQLSTRTRGAAGSSALFDPESPINPAALALVPNIMLHAQYEPEFRRVDAGTGAAVNSRYSRFPLIATAAPAGRNTVLGLSASTYLDRTYLVTTQGSRTLDGETFRTEETRRSNGGITDVRFAVAQRLSSKLAVGLAIHGFTGENRVGIAFADSTGSALSFSDSVRLNYGGIAASAGVQWRAATHLGVAAQVKRGGHLRVNDQGAGRELGSGRAPDEYGGALLYDGIAGATITAGAGWRGWSAMNELSPTAGARDAWEASLGADAAGPRFGSGTTSFRAGVGYRELPFALPTGENVDEVSFALGAGIPLAFNRAALDLALQRASRTAGDARETGWTLSLGVTIRP